MSYYNARLLSGLFRARPMRVNARPSNPQQRLHRHEWFSTNNTATATATATNKSSTNKKKKNDSNPFGLPKWSLVGTAAVLASPVVVALVQGAMMLQDFRQHHGNAPVPISPSRGLVVVESNGRRRVEEKNGSLFTAWPSSSSSSIRASTASSSTLPSLPTTAYEQKPLRLLVIGDSLAAGVGVSGQGTPILPEAIAKTISSATGGRAVRWTCVGTPGVSTSQIVQDILNLNNNNNRTETGLLETKLLEWQTAKRKAREWMEERQKQLKLEDNGPSSGVDNNQDGGGDDQSGNKDTKKQPAAAANRIQRWWKRVQRDVKSFRAHVLHSHKQEVQIMLKKRRMTNRTQIPQQDEYDVAVVLTGLNDLKDMFLPFMTGGANSSTLSEEARESASEQGLKGELIRVVNALKDKMRRPSSISSSDRDGSDVDSDNPNSSKSDNNDDDSSKKTNESRIGPLVVFPALPMAPLPICRQAPLSWFIVPLLHMIDNHKARLAERFPKSVLFVESPSMQAVQDLESDRGAIFESRNAEQVLLNLTDVTKKARERAESLMREHYNKRWGTMSSSSSSSSTTTTSKDDDDGNNGIKNNSVDQRDATGGSRDVYHGGCHDHYAPTASSSEEGSTPGSTLVAADNVHPNDEGYDFWGRHIGAAIVAEWEILDATSASQVSPPKRAVRN